MLPLYLSLSSRQLRLISALGTGILVGVALIIIIPEGVETLYSASEGGAGHGARSISRYARSTGGAVSLSGVPAQGLWRRQGDGQVEDSPGTPESAPTSHDPHVWVGFSLIIGFVLMYLIDTLPRQATSNRPERFQISLNNLSFNRRTSSTPGDGESAVPPTPTAPTHDHSSRPSSTTTGLVIHACADGIALGASSTTTSSLTFIIFIALIVHKAPAAFGLTSVLLKQGLSKRIARAHLIVFSLAAPIGALATWTAAHLLGSISMGQSSSMTTEFATGVLLTFSGGTFLYVATHTMSDSGHDHDGDGQMNGYQGVSMSDVYETSNAGAVKETQAKSRLSETGLTVLGMLLPLLFQFGHGH